MNVIKKILTNILIYGTEFIVIMLSVFPIVWVASVSYTHLDVYKRQDLPVFLFHRMEVWKERLVCCKIQPKFFQYMNFIDNLPWGLHLGVYSLFISVSVLLHFLFVCLLFVL